MSTHAVHRTTHHPRVERNTQGGWVWACSCGGASCRTAREAMSWRLALIGALLHAGTIAP